MHTLSANGQPKTKRSFLILPSYLASGILPRSRVRSRSPHLNSFFCGPRLTAHGGVKCWVVKAQAKKEWLPNYYAPTIIYWLDQRYFYPLRIEQYGADGNLTFVETRFAEHMNPGMGDQGYGMHFNHYWDVTLDYMRYSVHDAHVVREWSEQDQKVFFNPAVLPRKWHFAPLKSQVEVTSPEQFFLRPTLDRDKFPQHRKIELPPALEAAISAQEAAGHLVFQDEDE